MLAVVPILTAAVLLTWPPGVRRRIAIGATPKRRHHDGSLTALLASSS
ncbi:hypothetical protein [Labedella phragmitis]|nr:hypothetical protein [Labedella phragmitis]